MPYSFRLFSLILLVSGLGVATATAQSSGSDAAVRTSQALAETSTRTVSSSSVVLKGKRKAPEARVGARTTALQRYADTTPLQQPAGAALQTTSFQLKGGPNPLQPQSAGGNTRTVLYVVGGALVVGGAIVGILALDDGPDPIPAPPTRPPNP